MPIETIKKETLKDPDLLSKEEIEQLLPILDDVMAWAKKLQEYALEQALKGVEYAGYKVVEGRTKRVIENEDAVAKALIGAGYAEALIFERKMLSLSKLEALCGKKKCNDLAGAFVTKPEGAPTLVPMDDPREPIRSSAADDFGDGFGESFTG